MASGRRDRWTAAAVIERWARSLIHEAQTLTYLKHSKLRVGLLLNFNVLRLTQGIRRFVR